MNDHDARVELAMRTMGTTRKALNSLLTIVIETGEDDQTISVMMSGVLAALVETSGYVIACMAKASNKTTAGLTDDSIALLKHAVSRWEKNIDGAPDESAAAAIVEAAINKARTASKGDRHGN